MWKGLLAFTQGHLIQAINWLQRHSTAQHSTAQHRSACSVLWGLMKSLEAHRQVQRLKASALEG